jgi:hypothetical protein
MLLTPLLLALFFSYTPANSIQDPPSYYPSGPQQNVDKSIVESGGWTLCWSGTYDGNDLLSNITTACDSDYIMYAGGLTGNSNLMLLAAGKRAMVFTIQPGMSNQTILENGSYWYFNTNMGSMGFAPNSTIQQSSADVYAAWGGNLDNGSLRLSWHTGHCGDGKICNGWRVGQVVGLNWGTQYTRYIYESTGGVAPTPTPEPTPTPTETITPIPEPTPTPTETITPTPEPTPIPSETPNPVDPGPTQEPVVIPTDELEPQVTEEPQVEEEQILEPSPEPTPIEEIIPVEEEINNAIDELIVNEEEISNEQLQDIADLLLDNYEVNEAMPVAELLNNLNDEQVLELLQQLDENQVIEYREGVEIEAGVAVIFEQLADPAALIGELFSDPSQVAEALGQLGADMTEKEREDSQDVVVASIIATQAIGAAMAAIPPTSSTPTGGTSSPLGSGGGSGGGDSGGGGGESEGKDKKLKGKRKPKLKNRRNTRRIK